jgi:hypothetical protein
MLPLCAADAAATSPAPAGASWIDARRVTVAEYRACSEAGACPAPSPGEWCPAAMPGADDRPMACVTLAGARAYCGFAGKRLPTTEEWALATKTQPKATFAPGVLEEWLGSRFCSAEIGGCGHAPLQTYARQPGGVSRTSPDSSSNRVGFRCAWSKDPPPAQPDPPPPAPRPTATPGRVWCQSTTCDAAKEVCCRDALDGVGRCAPKGTESCGDVEIVVATCDESADCKAGESCCPYWGCSDGCPEQRVCQRGACKQGDEVCLPGGACRAGRTCVAKPGETEGRCTFQRGGASCGSKRCAGTTPVCCWDQKTGTGTCSAGDCAEGLRSLACTSPKDCGGSTCGATSPDPRSRASRSTTASTPSRATR